MAFLAKGHTPGNGPYGDNVNRAIEYVLSLQTPSGLINGHGPMYTHGISTLMLSEVSGMVNPQLQARIDEALPRALRLILDAQAVSKSAASQGGWRYQPTSRDSDLSCTGWQLMALRSARNAGAAVPRESIDYAVAYVVRSFFRNGSFGYTPGRGGAFTSTGTGLLCLELCGLHGDPMTTQAGDWIVAHLPNFRSGIFYYGLYYCSQGMFQLGGDHWHRWAVHMYEMMLPRQAADGSFPAGSGHESTAGICYSTSMSVLALSVSYRQLPIYQR